MSNSDLGFSLKQLISPGGEPVIIFGASRAGLFHKRVFDEIGIPVACFADNDPEKIGKIYLGNHVLHPSQALTSHPSAFTAIALMDASSVHDVEASLSNLGFERQRLKFLTPDVVELYLNTFSRRRLDNVKYQNFKFDLFNSKGLLRSHQVSHSFTLLVTERCNLACQDCAAFVPQNKDPKSFSAVDLIEDVKKYASAFEFVYRVCIMGGEPFLHKEISQIIEEISKINNILFIDIATNGTVIPQSKLLDVIKENAIGVEISDYGNASRKMNEFFRVCEEKQIVFYHQDYSKSSWGELGLITKQNRDAADSSSVFLRCLDSIGIRNHIVDNKLHRCLFSAMVHRLRLVPDDKTDYVELQVDHTPSLVSDIRDLTFRTKPLSACDFCKGPDRSFVPAGIQPTIIL